MRVWIISDIHVDYAENESWIRDLSDIDYQKDALILAGDVCHDFNHLKNVLTVIKQKFAHLFFTPGNHDLWVRDESWTNSIEKLEKSGSTGCKTACLVIHPRYTARYMVVKGRLLRLDKNHTGACHHHFFCLSVAATANIPNDRNRI